LLSSLIQRDKTDKIRKEQREKQVISQSGDAGKVKVKGKQAREECKSDG
jgi:hypothetical protein